MVDMFINLPRDSQFNECKDIRFREIRTPARKSFQSVMQFGPRRYISDLTHDAEINSSGGKSVGDSEVRKCVEEAASGGIGCLAAVPDDAAGGGEEDEEVESVGVEDGVEVPGAVDFGFNYLHPVAVLRLVE